MKKQIFTGLVALGATVGAFAQPQQGTVSFDNGNANPAATLSSKSFGLIFACPGSSIIPLNQDINLTLLGGASAGSLLQIASLTFANGLAQGDNTFLGVPGQFLDPSGQSYNVPGVAALGTAFLEVEAWTGNSPTYQDAVAFGGVFGNSGVFRSATGGGTHIPVSVGDAMPSFTVGECPEPTTLAFGGLGAAALVFFRRRK